MLFNTCMDVNVLFLVLFLCILVMTICKKKVMDQKITGGKIMRPSLMHRQTYAPRNGSDRSGKINFEPSRLF